MCQQVVALAQGKVGEFASVLAKGEEMTSGAVRAVYKLNYSCENSPERTSHVIPLAETVPFFVPIPRSSIHWEVKEYVREPGGILELIANTRLCAPMRKYPQRSKCVFFLC